MAVLIQINKAHKSYGDQVLLDGADVSIVEGAKIGFVGRNGAGKSTLLKIILGEEEFDSGQLTLHPRLRVGYLRQHDPFLPGETAIEFLQRDSGQEEWKCGEVAGKFELKGDYLEGPVSNLSGGWQTRVKLAALLLHDPNLLLLDEPTNFLDLRTQILLEHFLRKFRGGILVVSHDRAFLKETCEQTLDLSRGKLTLYPGKIDQFIQYQAERVEHDLKVNQSIVTKQKQLQRFIDKNRAGANTASQARSKQKQLDRLQTTEIAALERTASIRAPRVNRRQGTVLRTTDLVIGYPDCEVARQVNLEIEHGQRAAIVGDNGQGKTTLLRSLVGSLDLRGGSLKWGHASDIGTYAQHVYSTLPESKTVLEYLEYQAMPGTTNQDILALAGALLFRDSHVEKKISVLSGGERARLCLAGLLLGEHNILVLDEPGNHLDVETVEALAAAFLDYQGTILFTSHDRHFMSRVATNIIEVRDGQARHYMGDYNSYLYSINQEIVEREKEQRAEQDTSAVPAGKPAPRQAQKMNRKQQKELRRIEQRISALEADSKSLNQQLLDTTDASEALKLHARFTEVSQELQQYEERWLKLTEE
ncbi:MAG: ABC-F family ATP-binding cassette domain-containing protein [Mariniblastus sp.]|nr:ABC-F family ATP-binding cassette domain-containing protein [Mariniblastus sp.]